MTKRRGCGPNGEALHRHHIVPRHAGGTNEPCNLVYLTVAEHAEAHRLLYEHYGRKLDRIAYLSLSKQIDGAEARRLVASERMKGVPKSEAHRLKLSEARKGKKLPPWVGQKSGAARQGRKATEAHRAAISAGQRGRKIPAAALWKAVASRQKTDGTPVEIDGLTFGSHSEAARYISATEGVSHHVGRSRARRLSGYIPANMRSTCACGRRKCESAEKCRKCYVARPPVDGARDCPDCGVRLSNDKFYRRSNGKIITPCKACFLAKRRESRGGGR